MDMVKIYQNRCESAVERIEKLPPSKITDSCKRTLLRLVYAELRFLERISRSASLPPSSPRSCNIGYLEAILHVLEQPSIKGVSRVCKPLTLSTGNGKSDRDTPSKNVHVDIVCTVSRDPVWFIISDRNPDYLSWNDSHGNKGLRKRIELILAAARLSSTLKPSSVICFFSRGLQDSVRQKLIEEFGFCISQFGVGPSNSEILMETVDDEWMHVCCRSYLQACALIVKVSEYPCASLSIPDKVGEFLDRADEETLKSKKLSLAPSFQAIISRMKDWSRVVNDTDDIQAHCGTILNFDTTALVAIVSGISNGCAQKLLNASETELKNRFKNNTPFVLSQAMSEIEHPIHADLQDVIVGKRCIMCKAVFEEFMELVSMYAGPNEKLRAQSLVKCIRMVPDCLSPRMTLLPTTRKLDSKNKLVFGTGDYWGAATLTANTGFVRAISQTGMPLLTVEHRSRALTGD